MSQTEISAQAALLDRLRHLGAPDDLAQAHPVDIAEALNLLEPRVAGRALSSLPFGLAVRVLEQPELDRRPEIFQDRPAAEAGRGMGLTSRQIFRQVELPLALPVLLAGLRIVIVQAIGLAVVAALIGAGGLGTFVFEGLGQYAVDLVLLGALPAIFLALAADFILQTLSAVLRRRLA